MVFYRSSKDKGFVMRLQYEGGFTTPSTLLKDEKKDCRSNGATGLRKRGQDLHEQVLGQGEHSVLRLQQEFSLLTGGSWWWDHRLGSLRKTTPWG